MSSERFFAIIGAQRSGTTWLSDLFDEHPGIVMAGPMKPEPKYFLDPRAGEQGRTAYRERYCPGATSDQVLGEKGTSYLEHPEAAPRMRALFPGCKAIAILRHPVQRAISNYHFTAHHGMETRSLAGVFLDNEPRPVLERKISAPPFDYLERGRYVPYLLPWQQVFGADLRIVVQEELLAEPAGMGLLYEWLGVDPNFRPADPSAKVNARAEGGDEAAEDAVVRKLTHYFAPYIAELEQWMGRRIDLWHDQIQ